MQWARVRVQYVQLFRMTGIPSYSFCSINLFVIRSRGAPVYVMTLFIAHSGYFGSTSSLHLGVWLSLLSKALEGTSFSCYIILCLMSVCLPLCGSSDPHLLLVSLLFAWLACRGRKSSRVRPVVWRARRRTLVSELVVLHWPLPALSVPPPLLSVPALLYSVHSRFMLELGSVM